MFWLISCLFAVIQCVNICMGRTSDFGCPIKLPTDIPENEPIYMTQNRGKLQLFKPDNETSYIDVNKNLTLFCPGKNNHITTLNGNELLLKCNNYKQFDHNNKLLNLPCTKTTTPELKVTRQNCANNQGNLMDIGFVINQHNFMKILTICYNNRTNKAFYSVHRINGAAIMFSVKENKRRDFKTTGMNTAINLRRIYQKQNQLQHFNRVFGSDQQYISGTSFLARGHLTPDADFIFPSAQLATYFYVNVAPEFQIVNTGNWKRVEYLAKQLASHFKTDLEIYTGTYDILKLTNSNGQIANVYLDNQNKIEVPKWFWKVIKNPKMNTATVLITLNNPFAVRNEVQEICPNVCSRASFDSKNFKDIRKGYTYCCDLNSFKEVINFLPSNLTSNGLLNCPSNI